MRKLRCVPECASIRIVVSTPAGIEIDVPEAVSPQTGRAHGIGLRQNILLIHHRARGHDGLLAVGAPAKIRCCAQAIHLSSGTYGGKRESQQEDRYQATQMELSKQRASMVF